MANNRIYLRCQACGDTLFLGKTLLEGYWYESYDGVSLQAKLNEFFMKHNYCLGTAPEAELPYDIKEFPLPEGKTLEDGAFDIVYEFKEESERADPSSKVLIIQTIE